MAGVFPRAILGGDHQQGAAGDPDVPIVGEELSASRALSDLAHKLLDAAAARIEKFGD